MILDELPFARLVVCDTEYQTRPGDLVLPVCLVAKELRSGQTWRLWMGEFGSSPPYPIDKDTLLSSGVVCQGVVKHRRGAGFCP